MKPDVVAWLRESLAEYAFRHPGESPAIDEFWELLEHADDITDPAHYLPGHLTSSAFTLDPEVGSLLLVHHEKLDRWLQPGGHIDEGDDSLERAAVRELAEETGVADVESLGLLDLDVHAIPQRGDVPEHLHYDVRFAFRSRSSVILALDGVREAVWARLDGLDEFDTDDSVLRAAAKLRSQIG